LVLEDLDLIGYRFRGFSAPHRYSTLILGVFPLDQIADVGVNPINYLKLFGREIIPTYVITVAERYRRTYEILWHNRGVASRGNNEGKLVVSWMLVQRAKDIMD